MEAKASPVGVPVVEVLAKELENIDVRIAVHRAEIERQEQLQIHIRELLSSYYGAESPSKPSPAAVPAKNIKARGRGRKEEGPGTMEMVRTVLVERKEGEELTQKEIRAAILTKFGVEAAPSLGHMLYKYAQSGNRIYKTKTGGFGLLDNQSRKHKAA